MKLFDTSVVGRKKVGAALKEQLELDLGREYKSKRTENLAASNTVCSELEARWGPWGRAISTLHTSLIHICVLCRLWACRCEGDLDALQGMRLPSLRNFNSTFIHCQSAFEQHCLGPAKVSGPCTSQGFLDREQKDSSHSPAAKIHPPPQSSYAERLHKAWSRSQSQFNKDYNDRLYAGLLFLSLGLALLFRFGLRVRLLEAACWTSFAFLELYPHLSIGGSSMYDTRWWLMTVGGEPSFGWDQRPYGWGALRSE